jgi:hypothetical protein
MVGNGNETSLLTDVTVEQSLATNQMLLTAYPCVCVYVRVCARPRNTCFPDRPIPFSLVPYLRKSLTPTRL